MNLYTFKNLGKVGRLGNQLWQVAATIGMAHDNNGLAYIRPSWDYKEFFSLPNDIYVKPKALNVVDGGTEYFQDLRIWKNVEKDIFKFFQPVVQRDVLPSDFVWCSIHVRRGDYLNNPDLFPFCGEKYYLNAIDHVLSLEPNVKFVVLSDDIAWCRDFFGKLSHDFLFIDGVERPVELIHRKGKPEDQWDMFLMMQCDYNIIANSTFSWWGAWLSGSSKVFYPSVWYGPGLSHVDWKLMIPDSKDWICVNVN